MLAVGTRLAHALLQHLPRHFLCAFAELAQRVALLAKRLGGELAEGDAYHPAANVEKMSRGEPLDDADREPWLRAIAADIACWTQRGENAIVTCSALKRSYRDILRTGGPIVFVHLKGSPDLLRARMAGRQHHFMPLSLLPSQLATLEPPGADEPAIEIDIAQTPETIVERILAAIGTG
ncbi:MAG: gluconokinase [Rhizobiales bacterium]|nr:gluconokinase [Hyphomicrobiales bacterium]